MAFKEKWAEKNIRAPSEGDTRPRYLAPKRTSWEKKGRP